MNTSFVDLAFDFFAFVRNPVFDPALLHADDLMQLDNRHVNDRPYLDRIRSIPERVMAMPSNIGSACRKIPSNIVKLWQMTILLSKVLVLQYAVIIPIENIQQAINIYIYHLDIGMTSMYARPIKDFLTFFADILPQIRWNGDLSTVEDQLDLCSFVVRTFKLKFVIGVVIGIFIAVCVLIPAFEEILYRWAMMPIPARFPRQQYCPDAPFLPIVGTLVIICNDIDMTNGWYNFIWVLLSVSVVGWLILRVMSSPTRGIDASARRSHLADRDNALRRLFANRLLPTLYYVSSAVFGCGHLFNYEYHETFPLPFKILVVFPYFILGLVNGWIYSRHGYWAAVGLHGMTNALFFGIAFLALWSKLYEHNEMAGRTVEQELEEEEVWLSDLVDTLLDQDDGNEL